MTNTNAAEIITTAAEVAAAAAFASTSCYHDAKDGALQAAHVAAAVAWPSDNLMYNRYPRVLWSQAATLAMVAAIPALTTPEMIILTHAVTADLVARGVAETEAKSFVTRVLLDEIEHHITMLSRAARPCRDVDQSESDRIIR